MRPITALTTICCTLLLITGLAAHAAPGTGEGTAVDEPSLRLAADGGQRGTDRHGVGIQPGRMNPHSSANHPGRTDARSVRKRPGRTGERRSLDKPDRTGVMPGDNVQDRRRAPSDKPDW